MTSRTIVAAVSCIALLAACTPDPERATLEAYLLEGQEISVGMNEMGSKFLTLTNVQANPLGWTQAEKDELQQIVEGIDELIAKANAMPSPVILKDVHPLLLGSLEEMRQAVESVVTVSEDPSKANDAFLADMEEHADKAEELVIEYANELELAVAEKYPDMVEE